MNQMNREKRRRVDKQLRGLSQEALDLVVLKYLENLIKLPFRQRVRFAIQLIFLKRKKQP